MTTEIISIVVGFLCTAASSLITFLLTKRKYNQEVASQQIKNIEEAFNVQKKINDETVSILKGRIDTLQQENNELRSQVHSLQLQMSNLITNIYQGSTFPNENSPLYGKFGPVTASTNKPDVD